MKNEREGEQGSKKKRLQPENSRFRDERNEVELKKEYQAI